MELLPINQVLTGLVTEYRKINAAAFLHGAFVGAEHTRVLITAINAAYTKDWPTKALREVICLDYHLEGFIVLADIITALRYDNIKVGREWVRNIAVLVAAMQVCSKQVEAIKNQENYLLGWYDYEDVLELSSFYLDKYNMQKLADYAHVMPTSWVYYTDYFTLRHHALWKLIHMMCLRPSTLCYSKSMYTHEDDATYQEILVMQAYYQCEHPALWDTIMMYAQCMLPKISLDSALRQLRFVLLERSEVHSVAYLLPSCLCVWVDRNASTPDELDKLLAARVDLLHKGGYLKGFAFVASTYNDWPVTQRYIMDEGLCVHPDLTLLVQIEAILASYNAGDKSHKLPLIEVICCHCNYARLTNNKLFPSEFAKLSMFRSARNKMIKLFRGLRYKRKPLGSVSSNGNKAW